MKLVDQLTLEIYFRDGKFYTSRNEGRERCEIPEWVAYHLLAMAGNLSALKSFWGPKTAPAKEEEQK